MNTTLPHTETIRLKNEKVRAELQRMLDLSNEAYCALQYEFYLAYLDVMFPSGYPDAEELKSVMSKSAFYRIWFLQNWNKKDCEFFSQLNFEHSYPGILCEWSREVKTDAGIYISSTFIASKEVLMDYYILLHQKAGSYDAIPGTVLRQIF